jgi:hypothetical protein
VFRFGLLDEDGTDLGPFVSSSPDWKRGDHIPFADGYMLEIVQLVDSIESGGVDYLIVKRI